MQWHQNVSWHVFINLRYIILVYLVLSKCIWTRNVAFPFNFLVYFSNWTCTECILFQILFTVSEADTNCSRFKKLWIQITGLVAFVLSCFHKLKALQMHHAHMIHKFLSLHFFCLSCISNMFICTKWTSLYTVFGAYLEILNTVCFNRKASNIQVFCIKGVWIYIYNILKTVYVYIYHSGIDVGTTVEHLQVHCWSIDVCHLYLPLRGVIA